MAGRIENYIRLRDLLLASLLAWATLLIGVNADLSSGTPAVPDEFLVSQLPTEATGATVSFTAIEPSDVFVGEPNNPSVFDERRPAVVTFPRETNAPIQLTVTSNDRQAGTVNPGGPVVVTATIAADF